MQNAIKISPTVLEFRHDITKILFFDRFEIRKTYGVSKRGTKCSLPPPPTFNWKAFLLRQKVFRRAGHELRMNCTQTRMWVFVKRVFFTFFLNPTITSTTSLNTEFRILLSSYDAGSTSQTSIHILHRGSPFLPGKEGLQGIFLSRQDEAGNVQWTSKTRCKYSLGYENCNSASSNANLGLQQNPQQGVLTSPFRRTGHIHFLSPTLHPIG